MYSKDDKVSQFWWAIVTVYFVQQGGPFDMQVSNNTFQVDPVDITLKENLT